MDRYRFKLIIFISFFLLISLKIPAQFLSECISDGVCCYITHSSKQNKPLSAQLYIYNGSKDTVFICDFNKYIHQDLRFQRKENRVFYWNLLTIDNQVPECITIMGFNPQRKISKQEKKSKNKTLVIPPATLFCSDIYLIQSLFRQYYSGYYKLCLYYAPTSIVSESKCVAETIIQYR
jgi:hypothetical protein